MAKKFRRILFVSLAVMLLAATVWQATSAQLPNEQYFPQTGHTLSGDFLAKYRSTPNALALYGYPTTRTFIDPSTERLVQFFQKARFELHPELPASQRVQISPLGGYIFESKEVRPASIPESRCLKFPEKATKVCYAFLQFYLANGGEPQFGRPISNAVWEGERIVQYFEKARFEWFPDYPNGSRVIIGNLGDEYFFLQQLNSDVRNPEIIDPVPGSITSLKAHAYPRKAVTKLNGQQTIYVVVVDQKKSPVQNAMVTLHVISPSGEAQDFVIPTPTNADGVTQFTFDFASDKPGIGKVLVTAIYDQLSTQTATSFRTWW